MKKYPFLLFLLTLLASTTTFAAKVDTVLTYSPSMKKEIPAVVITPDTYNQESNFPVVYLLHGYSGDYGGYVGFSDVAHMADQYNFIVVCPDGNYSSWYFDSPVDDKMKYETYISRELIDTIDKSYNTVKNRSGRAITGLSMGGHGAFYLAFKHQDIWGAAGSMSGGVDIRPFPTNWEISKRLGDYADHKELWEKNTVINMVYLLKGDHLKLIFDCGISDFFHDANSRLHAKLVERNIPHDYIERPGSHNWEYWANSIKYQLLFFSDYFLAGS